MGLDEASRGIGTGIGIAAMGIGLGIAFDSMRSMNKCSSRYKIKKFKPKKFEFKPYRIKW